MSLYHRKEIIMFCSQCGKQLDNNALFCTFCGARTNNTAGSPAPVSAPVSAPVTAVPETVREDSQPTPVSSDTAATEPVSQTAPQPVSEPVPQTAPQPVSEPVPQTVPQPAPAPAPEVQPAVTTEPAMDFFNDSPADVQAQVPLSPVPEEKEPKYYTFGHIALCLAAVAVMAIVAGVFAGLYFSVI